MTMGPDPSSMILWMSVRRGILAALGLRVLAAKHQVSIPFGLTGRD